MRSPARQVPSFILGHASLFLATSRVEVGHYSNGKIILMRSTQLTNLPTFLSTSLFSSLIISSRKERQYGG